MKSIFDSASPEVVPEVNFIEQNDEIMHRNLLPHEIDVDTVEMASVEILGAA